MELVIGILAVFYRIIVHFTHLFLTSFLYKSSICFGFLALIPVYLPHRTVERNSFCY